MLPRLLIAGVSSGVGKTTVCVAVARALRARGLRVAAFKCGPDYLDPTYHARAVDGVCHNLDAWMMGRDAVVRTFAEQCAGADLALVEGFMGLFDGVDAANDAGSSAEIARWLEAPVLLVVDASAMARSIAALVRGYADFDPRLRLAGVVANRVGSRGHLELLERAQLDPPIVGGFPTSDANAFSERHLGLHAADRSTLPDSVLDEWADLAERWCDLDGMLSLARSARPVDFPAPERAVDRRRCRIGVAHDSAFHFYYADNLRRLEDLGAELVRFSPCTDRALPDVDGLLIGGGYPELQAATLAANVPMLDAIRDAALRGMPIYAECGGLMLLARAIHGLDGTRHRMAGVIDAEVRMHGSLRAIGYVEVELRETCTLGEPGARFRGHQFRYSDLVDTDASKAIYAMRSPRGDDLGPEGWRTGNVVASYVHAHWARSPEIAEAFVSNCETRHTGTRS